MKKLICLTSLRLEGQVCLAGKSGDLVAKDWMVIDKTKAQGQGSRVKAQHSDNIVVFYDY